LWAGSAGVAIGSSVLSGSTSLCWLASVGIDSNFVHHAGSATSLNSNDLVITASGGDRLLHILLNVLDLLHLDAGVILDDLRLTAWLASIVHGDLILCASRCDNHWSWSNWDDHLLSNWDNWRGCHHWL
jgi:hypothetical protein